MRLPAPHSDFIGFGDDIVHLATGGQPPLLRVHERAFAEFAADKASGQAGYENHWQVGLDTKRLIAALTGIAPRLARLGVEPRVVKSDHWAIDAEQLLGACDDNTRLLYISQVTSLTGQRFDIAWLSTQLATRGVALLVDASHALGVVPVDARLADFTVSSCYKFLCGTHMGVLAWNRQRQADFNPLSVGWASGLGSADGQSYTLHDDARRAQSGNPNHLDVYLLKHSLAYLAGFGLDTISSHVMALSATFESGPPTTASTFGTGVAGCAPRCTCSTASRTSIVTWPGWWTT